MIASIFVQIQFILLEMSSSMRLCFNLHIIQIHCVHPTQVNDLPLVPYLLFSKSIGFNFLLVHISTTQSLDMSNIISFKKLELNISKSILSQYLLEIRLLIQSQIPLRPLLFLSIYPMQTRVKKSIRSLTKTCILTLFFVPTEPTCWNLAFKDPRWKLPIVENITHSQQYMDLGSTSRGKK